MGPITFLVIFLASLALIASVDSRSLFRPVLLNCKGRRAIARRLSRPIPRSLNDARLLELPSPWVRPPGLTMGTFTSSMLRHPGGTLGCTGVDGGTTGKPRRRPWR